MNPVATQFIIADGARARLVKRAGDAGDFTTTRELKADRRAPEKMKGVVFDSSTHRSYGVESRADAVRAHKTAFAREVAEAINTEASHEALGRLAIVAPARTLSAITAHLSAAAKSKLAGTLAKDLTKVPDHELKDWLRPLELG